VNANDRQDLAERLSAFVAHVLRHSGTGFVALIDETGLRPAQLKSLLTLAAQESPVSVGRLAELLAVSQPTASRIAAALEARGLLDTGVDPDDHRARSLRLSRSGHALVRRLRAARAADIREFVDGLPAGQCDGLAAALSELELELDAVPA
jgi:MarR family transcriptional regulator for hemolysin